MRRAANVGAINTRFSPFHQTKKSIAPIGLLMLPEINASAPYFESVKAITKRIGGFISQDGIFCSLGTWITG
jgi:hypothetical protein